MSVHYFMWAWRTLVLMLLIAVVGELAIINRRLTAIQRAIPELTEVEASLGEIHGTLENLEMELAK